MARRLRTTARKKPRQARSLATVEAILAATARVLTRVGFERASTNAIARVAGVSIGSLYQYFPSKEALVAALLERHVSALIALARSAFAELADEPVPVAARRLVEALFALHSQDPALYAVFVEQLPAVGRLKRIRDVEAELVRLTSNYLEQHRCEVVVSDPELAAFLVVQTLEALSHGVIREHPERLGDPALRDEVSALVVRYLTLS
jgi:AcrR family transcriptional regulator